MTKRRFSLLAGTATIAGLLIMGVWGGPHPGPSVPDRGTEIDKLFARWNTAETPGGAVVVILDGNIVHQKGYGMANLEWRIPNTPETVFCIGSVSKQFTAFCIALLEARGKLRLEDDYRKYIPEMPDYVIRYFIQGQHNIGCSQVNGHLWHTKNNTRCLVLGNGI